MQNRPRRVRRPGKPTAHKTRYYRPRGTNRNSSGKRKAWYLPGALLLVGLVALFDHNSIQPAVLQSISDGDTMRVTLQGKPYKIRLHGIDTPEYDQPFGDAAKRALQDLVYNKEITIKKRDEDQYGRLVAIVYANGENVNLQLVEDGYAWWYRDYAGFNLPLAYAEFSARHNDRGLWQNEKPTPPWEWRRSRVKTPR